MPLVAWVTLLATALILGAAALALLRVVLDLLHVSFTLGSVIVGVRAIAHQTRTVPEALTSVNGNLKPVRAWCETV